MWNRQPPTGFSIAESAWSQRTVEPSPQCSLAASEVDVRERDGFFSRLPLPDIWSTKPVFVRLAAHRLVMDAAQRNIK